MTDCLFCKIAAGEIPADKVYEDEEVLAFLDIKPVNPGHTLIVPKAHFNRLSELSDDLAAKLLLTAKKIAPAILAATGATDFNLTVNQGPQAGQVVEHFHWHLMPRLAGDGFALWSGRSYATGAGQVLAEKIRNNLLQG